MFIVIEGLDGAGKSTQVAQIKEWLEREGKEVEYLHFPRFDTPIYGELVAKFLRGDLGSIGDVNPYLVALIYAGDRAEASKMIKEWLAEGKTVLLDRYVMSNIAYQCAKVESTTQSEELKRWILELEYKHNNIAKPDVEIFLDVPFSFTKAKLKETRVGEDREYLKGKQDIHEASLSFQERVAKVYLEHTDNNYHIIGCADDAQGAMLSIEEISQKIKTVIENR